MVVLAGHSHIDENAAGYKWMARQFAEISHIDPLTINQSMYTDNELIKLELPSAEEIILCSDKDSSNRKNDIYVVNKTARRNLIFLGDSLRYRKVSIPLPEDMLMGQEDIILLVYLKSEFAVSVEPVPCFVKKIVGGEKMELELPDGNYIIIYKNANGKIISQSDLNLRKMYNPTPK